MLLVPAVPWEAAPRFVPALSPFTATSSAIAARSFTAVALLAVPLLVLVLVWRRWFCRWACPVGLLTDFVGKASPVPKSWCDWLPPLGRWAAVATLAGACAGYPLLLWMDPLAILAGAFGPWKTPLTAAAVAPMLGLPLVLLLSWLLPGAWCRRVCPLGATQELVFLGRRGFAVRRGSPTPPQETTEGLPPERSPVGMPLRRRSLLAVAAAASLGAWLGRKLSGKVPAGLGPFRPPGAAGEPQFAGLCVRCGNCVRACPADIIRPDLGECGVAGWLAPLVRIETDYCREDCVRCGEVCPSGAIRPLKGDSTKEAKKQAPIGLAVVDMEICHLRDNRECDICGRECPFEAVTFAWSDETYTRRPVVDAARCPGCGACQIACPATNQWERENLDPPPLLRKAIRVAKERGIPAAPI